MQATHGAVELSSGQLRGAVGFDDALLRPFRLRQQLFIHLSIVPRR
jgi:hypothetical protein